MYRSGLVDTLVTHANMKGLGLTSLFRDRRGFMPPQLKTKQKQKTKLFSTTLMDLLKQLLTVVITQPKPLSNQGMTLRK